MLNLLCGSISPDKGQIIKDGQDITKMKEYRRSEFISRVYQDPGKGSCRPSASLKILLWQIVKAGLITWAPELKKINWTNTGPSLRP